MKIGMINGFVWDSDLNSSGFSARKMVVVKRHGTMNYLTIIILMRCFMVH